MGVLSFLVNFSVLFMTGLLVVQLVVQQKMVRQAYRAGWWAARAETLGSFYEAKQRGLTDQEWVVSIVEADEMRAVAEGMVVPRKEAPGE
jgi:hypothetical protein